MPSNVRIGTQGWNYDAWVGPFYPEGSRAGDFLALYARAFNTVEVDSTFYAIPSEKVVHGWVERTPDDFVFALKLPQEITHERRLRDSKDLLAQFVERMRSEEHTSELQSPCKLVCRLLLAVHRQRA